MTSRPFKGVPPAQRRPYQAGKQAFYAGLPPDPPANTDGDYQREWKRGYQDARRLQLGHAGHNNTEHR